MNSTQKQIKGEPHIKVEGVEGDDQSINNDAEPMSPHVKAEKADFQSLTPLNVNEDNLETQMMNTQKKLMGSPSPARKTEN